MFQALGYAMIATLLITTAPAHAEHAHHVALFGGATHGHGVSYGTAGLEYEYRLSQWWGAGFVAESTSTDPKTTIGALLLQYHLSDYVRAFLGGGEERIQDHKASLTRFGVAYDEHWGEWIVSPTVGCDWIQGGHSAILYGIALGRGF